MVLPEFSADHQVWTATLMFYVMLGISSIAVFVKTRTSSESQLRKQVNSWWLIFPVVSLSLFFYPYGPSALVFFICALAVHELLRHHSGSPLIFLCICLMAISLTLGFSLMDPHRLSLQLPLLMLMQLIIFSCRRSKNNLLLLLLLAACFGLSFITRIVYLPLPTHVNLAWLFYLFVLTALNDIAQFVSGKCFGTRKIATRISPNKTWQGLAGGVVISVLVSASLGSYLQLASQLHLLVLAVMLSLGGFAGDLMFSAGKRFLSIKDFSQLIPGHGGILDRVDSLVVTAPLLYAMIYFSHNGFLK